MASNAAIGPRSTFAQMLAAQANSAASAAEQPTSGTTAGQGNQHLLSLQRNDLGTDRRNQITTHDLDSIYGTLSTQDLERHRRVNRESRQSGRERQQISSWNTAHLTLRDDDTYEDGLEDLNEGQSHRARLLATLPQQSNAASITRRDTVRGGHGGRPRAGRGARGGGAAGAGPGRSDQSRVSLTPSSRPAVRVVLPSITGRPAVQVSERPPIAARLPKTALHTPALAPPGPPASSRPVPTDHGNRTRAQISKVSLALPKDFLPHAFANVNRSETATSQGPSPSTPSQARATTGSVRVSPKVPILEPSKTPTSPSGFVEPPAPAVTKTQTSKEMGLAKAPAAVSASEKVDRVSHEPRMGTLLEADPVPDNSTATPATNAYMNELIGLEFSQPSLQAFQSSLESTLSILRQSLPSKNAASTALMRNIEAHFLDVQRELSRWSIQGEDASIQTQTAVQGEQGEPPKNTEGQTVLPKALLTHALDRGKQVTYSKVPPASEQVNSKAATEKRAELPKPPKPSNTALETKGHHQATFPKPLAAALTTSGEKEALPSKHVVATSSGEQGQQPRPVSLADTVQQRTRESFEQFTGGRVPIERPLFGEYVHRSRFLQRRDSIESVDSRMSISDVSTLPDRMQGVVSTHTQTPEAINSTGLGEGLSRTAFHSANHRSSGPTASIETPPGSDAKSATRDHRLSNASETRFSQPSSRPQLPAFLMGATRSDDPGAAARAQYSDSATAPSATLATSSRSSIDNVRQEAAVPGRRDTDVLTTLYGRSSAGPSSNDNTRPQRRLPSANDPLPRFSTPGKHAAPRSSGPRLPAFLAGTKPAEDPGAAARKQYEQSP